MQEQTNDEDTVTSLVQLGKHGREESELGGSFGQVGMLLLGAHSPWLNLRRDDVRVAERLAELHQDVVEVGLASLALGASLSRRLLKNGLNGRGVALEDTTVCG